MAENKLPTGSDVEEILASIRAIIDEGADEAEKAAPAKKAKKVQPPHKIKPTAKKAEPAAPKPKPKKSAPAKPPVGKPREKPIEEDVLLLTELAPEEPEKAAAEPVAKAAGAEDLPPELVAEAKKQAAMETRDLGIENSAEIDAALEDLVRSMLKEMLKDYLDKHMAEIVKKVAAEEVRKLKNESD